MPLFLPNPSSARHRREKGLALNAAPDPTILDNLINKWGKLKILIAALNRGPTKVAVKSPKTSPRQTRLGGLPLDA